MAKSGPAYKRQAQRYKEGDKSMLILPFDFILLSELPIEGTNVGGLYQLGKTARELEQSKFKNMDVGTGTVAARLRAMQEMGLVIQVRMIKTSGTAYQRTKLADKELAAWNPPTA